MQLVILESPFAGKGPTKLHRWLNERANIAYARRAMEDCLLRGEAPMVSHLLYTQVLDDKIPAERTLGIAAGLVWRTKATRSVVYEDRGISPGMAHGMRAAAQAGLPVVVRSFGDTSTSAQTLIVLYSLNGVNAFLDSGSSGAAKCA